MASAFALRSLRFGGAAAAASHYACRSLDSIAKSSATVCPILVRCMSSKSPFGYDVNHFASNQTTKSVCSDTDNKAIDENVNEAEIPTLPSNISEIFDIWCLQHHKSYSSVEEKMDRFNIFKHNYAALSKYLIGEEYCTPHLSVDCDRTESEKFNAGVHLAKKIGDIFPELRFRSEYPAVDSNEKIVSQDGNEDKKTTFQYPPSEYMSQLFDAWCILFKPIYASRKEKLYRFDAFKKNYAFVMEYNRNCFKNGTSRLALSYHGDRSAEDRKKRRSSWILGPPPTQRTNPLGSARLRRVKCRHCNMKPVVE